MNNNTCENTSCTIYFQEYFGFFYTTLDEQVTHLAVEVLLVLGMIWIILKKRNNEQFIKLDVSEEEALIYEYTPESLVPEVSPTHHALNQQVVQGKLGLTITINGTETLDFASHDYLGLIGNIKIEEKAKKCVDIYGVGACGPRGFYGTSVLHLELERSLAEFLETEDSILFSYGFATMASTIPAYAKKNDIVFVDEKCNFAIQQGLRASKSEIKFFKHNNMKHLEQILEETRKLDLLDMSKARKSRRHLVVEGIYLNTGEICDLPNIIQLCKKYKVRIFMDESISFGVLGKTGRGITEYFGIPRQDVDLIMASLEFSFASIGGFCAGTRFLVDHLLAAALGYMFSASLPPLLIQASLEALEEIKNHPEKLAKLKTLNNLMHDKLTASSMINEYFIISGHRDSPVHILIMSVQHSKQDEIIENIRDLCMKQSIVITRAAFLPDSDVAMTRPSLRITTTVKHSEPLISYFICVLEYACYRAFNNVES